MLDRIIREHSYAMNKRAKSRKVPEPELAANYKFLRARLTNRADELRRQKESAERRGETDLANYQPEVNEVPRLEVKPILSVIKEEEEPIQQVEVVKTELKACEKDHADEKMILEGRVRRSLLNNYRNLFPNTLAAGDEFPLRRGTRLMMNGRSGRVKSLTKLSCKIIFDGETNGGNFYWERLLKGLEAREIRIFQEDKSVGNSQ